MSIIQALLDKHLIPVAKHNNPTYALLAEHAIAASRAILGQPATFFVINSKRPNAYTLKIDDTSVIVIADSLLRMLETSIKTLLSENSITTFVEQSFGVKYPPASSPHPLTTGL